MGRGMMNSRQFQALKTMAGAVLSGGVRYLILHVTSACNARCRMCFNWDGMLERRTPGGPSLANLERLAASMKVLPQLSCSGGEPLLREDLGEIIQAFYDRAGTRFFSVPTNALRPQAVRALMEHFSEHCPKGFLNFCLPFHETAEHFDDVMGVPGSFEAFNESYTLVQEAMARAKNVSCVLNFVMSKFNYPNWRAIIDLAQTEYPDVPIGIALARGCTHEPDATEVPIDTYLEAQAYLGGRRRKQGRFNPYTIAFNSIGRQVSSKVADVVKGRVTDLKCDAGRTFLVVYETGDVQPCELMDVVGMPDCGAPDRPPDALLGNLGDFDYNMQALLESERAKKLVRWIRDHQCACTWECAIYNRIVGSPVELTLLAFTAAKHLLTKDNPPS